MQHMKFGVDWIMYVGVISFFVFHGEQLSNFDFLPRPHPLRFEKALQDFLWLKSNLAKFEACNMKCVGGVRSNAMCGNRQKWRQNACWLTSCGPGTMVSIGFFLAFFHSYGNENLNRICLYATSCLIKS